MSNALYLLCGLGPLLLLAYKFRAAILAPTRYKPMIQAICIGSVCAGISFALASPAAGTFFNTLTGIPSVTVLFVYLFGLLWVCFSQISVAYWRHPPEKAWRVTRRLSVVYLAVITGEVTLFVLGAPTASHHVDFTSAFAATPYLGELLLLHFTAYTIGVTAVVNSCWQWAKSTPDSQRWLRPGLRLIALGALFPAVHGLVFLVSVLGMRFGIDLSYWGVVVAPRIAGLGVPVGLVGMTIAVWGPRIPLLRQRISRYLGDRRDYRELRVLWHVLRPVEPKMVHQPQRLRDRLSLRTRLLWRLMEIHDWLHQLGPYRDPQLLTVAAQRGQADGLSAEDSMARAEAAEIRAAIEAKHTGIRADVATEQVDAPTNTKRAFASERARLVLISRAIAELSSSPKPA
ncbi:MAB_1171c family putative transporter [Crossiella sp. CA198]|uniref:MAB_1171c family putative transporter n=1 Tax=Crossiella sp. CA198 TaxID=3455607 RepID=UPI003F8D29E8